jgi:hypothetical protein
MENIPWVNWSFGGAYFLTKNWVLSAGYQIPTFQSKSVNALVFELTFIPH